MTNLVFVSVWQDWFSRLCDKLSFLACVSGLAFTSVCRHLVFASAWQAWFLHLSDEFSFLRPCDKLSFFTSVWGPWFSRHYYKFNLRVSVTSLVFASVWQVWSLRLCENFTILLLPQQRFFLIANRVLISKSLLVPLSLTELKTAHSWFGEKWALFSHPILFSPLLWSPLSLECATMSVFWTYGLKIFRFHWITFLAYLAKCSTLISKLLSTIKVAMTTSSCCLTVSPLWV